MKRLPVVRILILTDIAGKPYMTIDSDASRMTLWAEDIQIEDMRKPEKALSSISLAPANGTLRPLEDRS